MSKCRFIKQSLKVSQSKNSEMALGFGMVGFWVISLSKLEGKALSRSVKKKTNGGSRVHTPHCTAGEPGRDSGSCSYLPAN